MSRQGRGLWVSSVAIEEWDYAVVALWWFYRCLGIWVWHALARRKARSKALPTVLSAIQLLLEAGQHVKWERLAALPNV